MIENPLVSILIPAFNAEKFLESCMDSALNQTYRNLEIIVCDDYSTDNTSRILKLYAKNDKRVIVVKNEVNLGYLRTFNKLLDLSKGEFISFLDSDDCIADDKIEKQVKKFSSDDNLGLVGTNIFFTNPKGGHYKKSNYPLDHENIVEYINKNKQVCLCGSSVMITRTVYQKVGGYRGFFDGCPGEDFDWILRISENFRVVNIPDICYNYRFHPNSLTRKVHFSIKARHIEEIIFFLANQRKENGVDDLMKEDKKALERFVDEIESRYQKDEGLMYRKVSFDYALQRNYQEAYRYLGKSFKSSPKNINNIFLFIYILVLLIVPLPFLLIIKEKLNLKNTNKRL